MILSHIDLYQILQNTPQQNTQTWDYVHAEAQMYQAKNKQQEGQVKFICSFVLNQDQLSSSIAIHTATLISGGEASPTSPAQR